MGNCSPRDVFGLICATLMMCVLLCSCGGPHLVVTHPLEYSLPEKLTCHVDRTIHCSRTVPGELLLEVKNNLYGSVVDCLKQSDVLVMSEQRDSAQYLITVRVLKYSYSYTYTSGAGPSIPQRKCDVVCAVELTDLSGTDVIFSTNIAASQYSSEEAFREIARRFVVELERYPK